MNILLHIRILIKILIITHFPKSNKKYQPRLSNSNQVTPTGTTSPRTKSSSPYRRSETRARKTASADKAAPPRDTGKVPEIPPSPAGSGDLHRWGRARQLRGRPTRGRPWIFRPTRGQGRPRGGGRAKVKRRKIRARESGWAGGARWKVDPRGRLPARLGAPFRGNRKPMTQFAESMRGCTGRAVLRTRARASSAIAEIAHAARRFGISR